MKGFHLLALNAVLSAMLILAASQTEAQDRPAGSGPRNPIPSGGGQTGGQMGSGGHAGVGSGSNFGRERVNDIFLVEEQVVQVVAPQEEEEAKPAAPPASPPAAEPEKREPYAVGKSYSSLPPGCMKMIQGAALFYLCGGDWYQKVDGQYLAVAQP